MRIVDVRDVAESGPTVTREGRYVDRAGRERSWSWIERRGDRRAVVVAARTRGTGSLVMIRQFRVPFGRAVIELPAGLVDPGEDAAAAARRELAEETGYAGEVLAVSPPLSSSAGLTTETFHVVEMVVDETPSVPTAHEGSEAIEVFTVAPGDEARLLGEWHRAGELMDAKAWLVLRGA